MLTLIQNEIIIVAPRVPAEGETTDVPHDASQILFPPPPCMRDPWQTWKNARNIVFTHFCIVSDPFWAKIQLSTIFDFFHIFARFSRFFENAIPRQTFILSTPRLTKMHKKSKILFFTHTYMVFESFCIDLGQNTTFWNFQIFRIFQWFSIFFRKFHSKTPSQTEPKSGRGH